MSNFESQKPRKYVSLFRMHGWDFFNGILSGTNFSILKGDECFLFVCLFVLFCLFFFYFSYFPININFVMYTSHNFILVPGFPSFSKHYICDVIKQNELEFTNTDLRYSQSKRKKSFVSYCYAKPSTACISGSNQPIFIGFSAKCGVKNA